MKFIIVIVFKVIVITINIDNDRVEVLQSLIVSFKFIVAVLKHSYHLYSYLQLLFGYDVVQ